MIFNKNVKSTYNSVPQLELNVDTVYIRSNIRKVIDEETQEFYWEYDEEQLTFEEYFKKIIPENENAIAELSNLFSVYQQ